MKIGIIGGSGMENPKILENAKIIPETNTPYGHISDQMLEGDIGGVHCVLLSRHGRGHSITPTNVNYRANLWALAEQGVSVIIASTACGSLQEKVKPGELVFPDSVFDRTTLRRNTFFDCESGHLPGVSHAQMHPIYNEKLRQVLINTATELQIEHHKDGFGICIEGPRYSTRAESNVFRSWGASLINMTMMPEAALARELGIPYATTALITDYDCWREEGHVSVDLVMKTFADNCDKCIRLFVGAVKTIGKMDWTDEVKAMKKAAREAIMIDKSVHVRNIDCQGAPRDCPLCSPK